MLSVLSKLCKISHLVQAVGSGHCELKKSGSTSVGASFKFDFVLDSTHYTVIPKSGLQQAE